MRTKIPPSRSAQHLGCGQWLLIVVMLVFMLLQPEQSEEVND